jgi:hypothetical protein
MDLLSARKTFRRSDEGDEPVISSRQGRTSPGDEITNGNGHGNWFNRTSIHTNTQLPSTSQDDMMRNEHPSRDTYAGSNSHSIPMPMQIPITEMLNDPMWSQHQSDTTSNQDVGIGNLGNFDVNAVSTALHCSLDPFG